MAGIYSQGGSAGHRYAGWLSEVEAKNFQFGGKVFNGSPSAIYVGSKMVWMLGWLTKAAKQAIKVAFGADGAAVINATNAYLNGIAAQGAAGKSKAQALAGFINEDPMMVCSLGLEVEGVTMPIRWLVGDTGTWVVTNWYPKSNFRAIAKIRLFDSIPSGTAFGAAITYNEQQGFLFAKSGQYTSWYWTVGGAFVNYGQAPMTVNTVYNVDMTRTRVIVNGTPNSLNGGTFTSPHKFCIFSRDGVAGGMPIGYAEHKNYEDTTLVQHLVPIIGTNKQGFVDLVSMEYNPKVGTGTFTEVLTQQDGVTPWTPPTP